MASISVKTKIQAVEQYYAGAGSLNQIAERFGVHRSTLQKWLLNYDLFGEEGLRHRAGNHHYPAIVKQQAVKLCRPGGIGQRPSFYQARRREPAPAGK